MSSKMILESPMLPLWIKYPHISRYSIGWRMGDGEEYAYKFSKWFSTLNEDKKKFYIENFPEPVEWAGWYDDRTPDDHYEDNILTWDKVRALTYCNEYVVNESKLKDLKYILFWGHQPSKKGIVTKSCFSQWWESEFSVDQQEYFCMEQYMMAEKARLFKDDDILKEIMNSNNPGKIKALGRKVSNFDEAKWNQRKYQIVLQGNYHKFTQNSKLRKFIIETGNKIIVEASPYDKIWGIGMAANNPEITKPSLWKGTNLLGYALMEVRDEIRRVYKELQ